MAKETKPPEPTEDDIIEKALADINKSYGAGTISKYGKKPSVRIDVISSGSLQLDRALGVGGFPRGRVVEIFGPESSGKTTLALHAIAEAQAIGGRAAFIDIEHALDIEYARKLGVNVDNLIISQPDNAEQALGVADTLVKTGKIDIVIIDSVAALVPQVEIEGEMGDSHMGVTARLMGQALRKLTPTISKTGTIVIFINQIRMKIGVVYGNPETTTGGNALKFYASIRIDIRGTEQIKDGQNVMGKRVIVKVIKNKVAPPFKTAALDIMFNEGVSRSGELIDYGAEHGLIEKTGAWYSCKGVRIGQGRDNAKQYLRDHPNLMKELSEAAWSLINKELGRI